MDKNLQTSKVATAVVTSLDLYICMHTIYTGGGGGGSDRIIELTCEGSLVDDISALFCTKCPNSKLNETGAERRNNEAAAVSLVGSVRIFPEWWLLLDDAVLRNELLKAGGRGKGQHRRC